MTPIVRRLPATLALSAFLFLGAGCSTFHSSSIAGYEPIVTPVPVPGEGLLGGDLKVAALEGLFTRDSTRFVQASVHGSRSVWGSGGVRAVVRGAFSGYFADTTVYDNPFGSEEDAAHRDFTGWGGLVHLQPSVVTGDGAFLVSLGWNNVYNREFGDYSRFRHGFGDGPEAGSSLVRVNRSPHDSSLTTLAQANLQWGWGRGQAFNLGLGSGLLLPDWPYSGEASVVSLVSVLWRSDRVWIWGSWQVAEDLNSGVSVGWGWSFL